MRLGLMLGEQPAAVPALEHLDSLLRQLEAGQRNGVRCYVIGHHFAVPGGARWLQPIPLLARLAAEVDRDVRLVPWVLVSPLYPTVILAEELATLDIVTEGRLTVGVGVGYRPEEYAAVGLDYEQRNPRFEAGLAELKALWDSDLHVRPLQQPHPPIWIGAQTPAGIRRAARLADGWAISPQPSRDVLRERFAIYRAALETAGKPLLAQPYRQEIVLAANREDAEAEMRVRTARHYGRVGTGPRQGTGIESGFLLGTADECAAELRSLAAEFPIDTVIPRALWPSMTTDDAIAYIDQLGRELMPQLADVEWSQQEA